MSRQLGILAAGGVDARGVAGSDGVVRSFDAGSGLFPAARPAWSKLFDRAHPGYRRLDWLGRAVALSAEAARVADHIDPTVAEKTAVVLGTGLGCVDTDLRFAASLAGEVEPALFPYTLSSMALTETMIRFGLRGPTLVLSTPRAKEGEALDEAIRLIECGQASRALLFLGDALSPEAAIRLEREPVWRMVCLVIGGGDGEAWCSLGELEPGAGEGSTSEWILERLFD